MSERLDMNVLLETCATSSHVTGLERVANTLCAQFKHRIPFTTFSSSSTKSLIISQYLKTPKWLLQNKSGIVIPITFPPSLLATALYPDRIIPYIHDLFLIDGKTPLNRNARLYMVPAFKQALRRCSTFLTNSETTRSKLRAWCNPDARIELLRPIVDDVFNIGQVQPRQWDRSTPLRLITVGTVEPRKGLLRAARLCADLERALGNTVVLDVIGRKGWGNDWDTLSSEPNVKLHGYLAPSEVQQKIADAHMFISASHDEGLGLPLLEVQHGSKVIIASDIPAYREVLGDSGILLNFEQPDLALKGVLKLLTEDNLANAGNYGKRNVERWNNVAAADLNNVIGMLEKRTKNVG